MTAAAQMEPTEYPDTNLLDEWLELVARDGYAFLYWPHWSDPDAMVAFREWRGLGITDVISLVHERWAFGYRALTPRGVDLLAPDHVLYVSEGDRPVHILRAVSTLPGPHEPSAPDQVQQAPPGIGRFFGRLGTRRTLRPAGVRQPMPRFKLRPKPEPLNAPSSESGAP
jgi:hypothetical protein